jgi:hypothetical protein
MRHHLRHRYGHGNRARKEHIREVRPYVHLYRDPKTGIAWIEDGTSGISVSVHPNIDSTGSIRGMRDRGYWGKKDRTVRSHGWIYNIDRIVASSPDERLVASVCDCGGVHK